MIRGFEIKGVNKDDLLQPFKERFGANAEAVCASPGRIEFIGNHTDYNGGEVLGVALDREVRVAIGPRSDGKLCFASEGEEDFEGAVDTLVPRKETLAWANYPLGILKVMKEETGAFPDGGLNLLFSSDLPIGAGLSSSAAMELATLEALCALLGKDLPKEKKVLMGQRAENEFVGVPCGILDQAVSCFGREDHLVRIDCATTSFSTVALPGGLHFHVFNTNCKHSLVDSQYAERHRQCREALRLIRERARPDLDHLAHASPDDLEALSDHPVEQKRARHVIEENLRVRACVECLGNEDLAGLGEALFSSHESSRLLFENSIPELDTFVRLLGEAAQRGEGVVGARLSGGGFGGAVMALTDDTFDAAEVLAGYREAHPDQPPPDHLKVDSGPGTRRL